MGLGFARRAKLKERSLDRRVDVLVVFIKSGAELRIILIAVRLRVCTELVCENHRCASMAIKDSRCGWRVKMEHLLRHFFRSGAVTTRGLHAEKGMMRHRVPSSPPLGDRIGH